MKRRLLGFSFATAMLTVLVGCGSTPASNHYLLTSKMDSAPTGSNPSLGIGPIKIPTYLDRDTLVTRGQGNQLHLSPTERWAEPLHDGLKRVLNLNMASLLNTQDIRSYPWNPKRAPDFGLQVTVLTLDSDNNSATLVAEWLIYNTQDGSAVERKISQFNQPLSSTAAISELPEAYSELLFQLSEEIASAIRSHATP